ncbi:cytochrome b [Acidisphaera sp. L21]|uniref:cytochrome b n=1 Tax=Acidisphaera sp. L21 TaxID=1641851 RepID=UPI00131E7E17|nr:cytochrome b/b6 domain-containing protein [Acidisphaera sp. L21]
MSASDRSGLSGFAAPRDAGRYDAFTILLHWLTALLVVLLFGLAITFNYLGRGTPLRHNLQLVHVSFGIGLAAVFVVRLIWTLAGARALPRPTAGAADMLARAMHALLYLLLASQIVLGFLYRWAQGEEFTFFGLFAIPPAFAPDRPWARTFDGLHYYVAWTLIVLAAGHAAAALLHHYILRDGVLRRMLPVKAPDA